jgi:hypothetical protein
MAAKAVLCDGEAQGLVVWFEARHNEPCGCKPIDSEGFACVSALEDASQFAADGFSRCRKAFELDAAKAFVSDQRGS